jgi:hypothetical protein
MGILAGLSLAVYYRNEGPPRKKFSWELQEEDDPRDDENAYWRIPPPPPKPEPPAPIEVNYIYKETEKPENQNNKE